MSGKLWPAPSVPRAALLAVGAERSVTGLAAAGATQSAAQTDRAGTTIATARASAHPESSNERHAARVPCVETTRYTANLP